MPKVDFTNKIERIEAFEDRVGVSLEALSASINVYGEEKDDAELEVMGEVHPVEGTGISSDVKVQVMVYDGQQRLVATAEQMIDADGFFGFEAFDIGANQVIYDDISRIRVLPKPW